MTCDSLIIKKTSIGLFISDGGNVFIIIAFGAFLCPFRNTLLSSWTAGMRSVLSNRASVPNNLSDIRI